MRKKASSEYSVVHPEESKSCSTLGSRGMSAPGS